MGSSIYALRGTLEIVLKRLNSLKDGFDVDISEYFKMDELVDELEDEEILNETNEEKEDKINPVILNKEINYIESMIEKTNNIQKESKYDALLNSLNYSFSHLKDIGANEKVLIFTESRRTQDFLYESLKNDGYEGVLLYNGSNNDNQSKEIYDEWISRPENKDKINNNRNLNMRSAILDKFKTDGTILEGKQI